MLWSTGGSSTRWRREPRAVGAVVGRRSSPASRDGILTLGAQMMHQSTCPSTPTLLRQALQGTGEQGVAAHVAGCAACGAQVAALREAAAAMRGMPAGTTRAAGCLDELAVARIADGGGTGAELDHLAQCDACRSEVAAVAGAIAAQPVAAEIERLEMPARPVWQRGGALAGVAAAVLLATVLARSSAVPDRGGGPTYRDPAVVQAAPPTVLAPVEDVVSRPVTLRWTSSAAATEYRLTVFDMEGSIVWEGKTTDTSVAIPADVPLAAGVQYWWRVEARVGFDRWSQSEVTPFTIGRPAAEPGAAASKGR